MIDVMSIHNTTKSDLDRSPLDGIRVLDLTNMLSGPYCTRLLADLGAEVIKVEPLDGDHNRGRRPIREGHSSFFGHLNCGKKSVVLDLKSKAGLAAAIGIASESDVVVENWRPGVASRLGVGYENVKVVKPDIVYCSISGFGQTGPLALRPAYAPILHAASGFDLAQVEYQGGGERPHNTATYTADVFGGMSAFAAIQLALFHRSRSGEGQFIDVSLLDGMLNIMVAECQETQAPSGTPVRVYPPVRASDGFIVIAPTSQKNFEALTRVIGKPAWLQDVRFSTTIHREQNWAEMMHEVETWAVSQTSAEAEAQFLKMGVPCTRYQSFSDAMNSEHVRARGVFSRIEDPAGSYLVPSAPFQMPGMRTAPRADVPAMGAHTDSVLSALLGYDSAQRAACAGSSASHTPAMGVGS